MNRKRFDWLGWGKVFIAACFIYVVLILVRLATE